MLSEAYLGMGSNLGDRRRNIAGAVRLLQAESAGLEVSGLYETAPKGFPGQPPFLNAACRLWTRLDPFELLEKLKEIQSVLGSRRAFVNGPRTLDIDILVYGSLVLRAPGLAIPHPRMTEREFVLAPLAVDVQEDAETLAEAARDGHFVTTHEGDVVPAEVVAGHDGGEFMFVRRGS